MSYPYFFVFVIWSSELVTFQREDSCIHIYLSRFVASEISWYRSLRQSFRIALLHCYTSDLLLQIKIRWLRQGPIPTAGNRATQAGVNSRTMRSFSTWKKKGTLLLVFDGPACYLPWARVLLLPLILVGAYWISIFWIFFTSAFSCASRASGGVRVPRESGSQPSIEQPALALRSSNNKEQPASLSSSSNDQLLTDSPSSSIAAEPSPSLRLNGFPPPCSKGKVLSLNRPGTFDEKIGWPALLSPQKGRIPYFFIGKSTQEKYVFRNAMWIGSLSPHPASINSTNIRFKKNLKAV